jgi:hypothetical protein
MYPARLTCERVRFLKALVVALLFFGSLGLWELQALGVFENRPVQLRSGAEAVVTLEGSQTAVLAVDEAAFAALAKARDINDPDRVRELLLSGQLIPVDVGTRVRVLERAVIADRRVVHVRVLKDSGLSIPPSGWIPEQWLRPD